MAKFNVTGEQRDDIDGRMIEIKRQLRLKSGSPIDPELVKIALQDIVEGKFVMKVEKNEIVQTKPLIVRLISGGQSLILKALDGSRLIYKNEKTFKAHWDKDFVSLGINNPGIATLQTPVQVHEIPDDNKFMDIFVSLPGTWNQKWLSQDQVVEFCETLPDWLTGDRRSTLFLIKKDERKPIEENNPEDNLAVVRVGRAYHPAGLIAHAFSLGFVRPNDFGGELNRRVVSPQVIPLAR